ncbi:MAG: hypothetical protein ACXWCV_09915 [Caldimonas sp.]
MSVIAPRPTLYERLPELYRQRDLEQTPSEPLRAFVDAIDSVLQALAAQVGAQYDDLFIETCDDWVVAYLADLVGTSHLKGDPWTLRADVARTVKHRRRKGTLGAVESQVHALSGWAVHAIELRERMAWNQPLNHLRPDVGGGAPFGRAPYNRMTRPIRGGTATLRSPAWLSFVGSPFDPFAHTADVRPPLLQLDPAVGRIAPNLPNLGVFLWRLADFQAPVTRPSPPRLPWTPIEPIPPVAGAAAFAVRFELHPQGEPMVLFNTWRYAADAEPPNLATIDAVPGPMPMARLTSGDPAGRPEAYVRVEPYAVVPSEPDDEAPGLVLHVPQVPFGGIAWTFRGAELCAWEEGLFPPLRPFEIAIDPRHGRIVFGVTGASTADFADPLAAGLRVSAATGAVGARRKDGSVGAQPLPRLFEPLPAAALRIAVDGVATTLADALADLALRAQPLVVEIVNSDTHELDLSAIAGIGNVGGVFSLRLPQPQPDAGGARPWTLTIRAASGERPVIRLAQPLRIRPQAIVGSAVDLQALQNVRLQGLYLTRGAAFPANAALIEQAVVNRLEIDGCTLDPGGALVLDGTATGGRAPLRTALRLPATRGLTPAERQAFMQTPEISLRHSICGALAIDDAYLVGLEACIVDAGAGVLEGASAIAIGAATGNPELGWGAPIAFAGVTVFGRSRVERARGEGALFVRRLEVHDNQDSHVGPLFAVRGESDAADLFSVFAKSGSCIRASWFSGDADRLPQHVACVFGTDTMLRFGAERFGAPAYAQLSLASDRRIREDGPNADEMGAFGFLLGTHKWKNIGIRLREFAPVGVRVLLIPVT